MRVLPVFPFGNDSGTRPTILHRPDFGLFPILWRTSDDESALVSVHVDPTDDNSGLRSVAAKDGPDGGSNARGRHRLLCNFSFRRRANGIQLLHHADGNILSLESPAGAEHIRVGVFMEGYTICDHTPRGCAIGIWGTTLRMEPFLLLQSPSRMGPIPFLSPSPVIPWIPSTR